VTNLIVWQSLWNTDIPELDQHHIAMVDQLNRLVEILRQPAGTDGRQQKVEDTVNRYLRITREHFEWEEQQMRDTDFPGYARHKRDHTMLLAEVNQLLADIKHTQFSIDTATLRALKHWVIAHITLGDRSYAEYCSAIAQTAGDP